MTHVPLEVIMHIMELACDDRDSDKHVLAACSLVCRDWAPYAQKLLFRHVSLSTQRHYEIFRTAVDRSTVHGRVLSEAVVSLRVTLDHKDPLQLISRSFAHAMTLCPNLEQLSVSLFGNDCLAESGLSNTRHQAGASTFDEDTLALLKTGPAITSLQFDNFSDDGRALSELLGVWPTLKRLSIGGTPPQLPPVSPSPACSFDQLRLNFQRSPSVLFMEWLLLNSHSLKELDFVRRPSAELMEYLVETHSATLETYLAPVCPSPQAKVIELCSALKGLVVERPFSTSLRAKNLSDKLEHLGFGLDKEMSLISILETVKAKPALKAITVYLWRDGAKHPQLSSLKIACAFRGINLQLTDDVHVFRALVVSPLR